MEFGVGVLIRFEGGAAYVLLERALECSICRRSTACLVNRDGRTRCYDCDAAYLDSKAFRLEIGAA